MGDAYIKSYKYIKSHALVNRCYNMLKYFNAFNGVDASQREVKKQIESNLMEIETVETYAKYFNVKKNKNMKKIELRCNLIELINDLNFLKQYLEKESAQESRFLNVEKEEKN